LSAQPGEHGAHFVQLCVLLSRYHIRPALALGIQSINAILKVAVDPRLPAPRHAGGGRTALISNTIPLASGHRSLGRAGAPF
jgi:flagellar biosynthesis/type III secretory pathway ATPase